jgi:cardiolipin synthase
MKEIMLHGLWEPGLAGIIITFQLAGIGLSGRVLLGNRSTQGTIAWVLSLLLLPLVAVPLYLVFGRNRLPAYVDARRRVDQQFDLENAAPIEHPEGIPQQQAGDPHLLALLQSLAKHPISEGNSIEFFFDGQSAYRSLLNGIASAEHYILFQFFIFRPDSAGREFIELLKQKARLGVRVYFLVDAIGSRHLSRRFFADLNKSGIATGVFKPGRTLRGRLRLNFRNHRKIVVVDGKTAWVGGNNIGQEYLGHDLRFGPWRDTHVQLKGPAVNPVQLTFMEDWFWVNRDMLQLNWKAAQPQIANTPVVCLSTGPADTEEACTLAYVHLINQAKKRLWIHSPYFVPSEEIIVALQLAALRGVDVRILLPGKFDKWLVWLCSFYFSSLSRLNRVRFYRFREGFFHSKLLLVDDQCLSVGTVNFDNRSFSINFEISLIVSDLHSTQTCAQQMEKDFARADLDPVDPLAHKSLIFNLAARAARLLSPLL